MIHHVHMRAYAVSTQETENSLHTIETFTQQEHGDDYLRRALDFARQTSVRVGMVPVVVDEVTGPGDLTERHRFLDGEEVTGEAPASRTAAYELGRARGYVTGRAEPDDEATDYEHLYPDTDTDADTARLGRRDGEPIDMGKEMDDFAEGMLDGAEQARDRKLGLPVPPPPSDEALAAARVGMVST